jgi:hypothetical protein
MSDDKGTTKEPIVIPTNDGLEKLTAIPTKISQSEKQSEQTKAKETGE